MADNTPAPSTPGSTAIGTTKAKSKKPADSAFKQQRLPAWQPVMTARTVIPAFFVIGVIFVPIGAFMYDTANKVEEFVLDYTESCGDCYNTLNTSIEAPLCECTRTIELERDFVAPVFMYYGLDNFYQNHRRYVKSRDDKQLLGTFREEKDLTTDCDPYRYDEATGKLYAPCGAIANSLFNDTITLNYNGSSVPVHRTGIAWPTDREDKFRNPPGSDLSQAKAFSNTIHPPNWRVNVWELDPNDTSNNGYQNEDLIVWMRTAALPNFRKLYRRINHEGMFASNLPAGNYTVDIQYNYPVKDFGGRKKIILSTTSWLGGKNLFLGVAYMTVGVICILLAVVFLVVHLRIGNKVEKMTEVTENTPYNH